MTTTFSAKIRLSLLLCFTGLLCFAAPKARADQGDPPTRVARISYVDGSVSLQPGGQGEWGSAARNRPMTIGDKIWVDKDSRAELQAGQAAIHLGSMTALSFLNLDQGITQMRLAEGSINFRVRELREGDLYEVDAPNLAFTVKQAGAFRIDVNENGDATRVTVIRGEGEVTAGGKTYEIHGDERGEFNGTENIQYSIGHAPAPDGLDRWAEERDLKEDRSGSARYVSRDMVGYADLDDYGYWRDEPEYGHVWYPNYVGPGWAPYSYGYWNWVDPWGWTWVDYAPWGFAPFHYGRWAFIGGAWGWCPGPFFGPPIWGPAFVGFFGGGFGFGIGWFPLGFGDPFFPFFRSSVNFITIINVRNTFIRNPAILTTTSVRSVNFVNARNVSAVTVATRNAFVSGQAINRGAVHLTPAALRGAQVTNSVGLRPTQHSSLGAANIGSHIATPSAAVQNRAVIARTTPAQGASHMPVRTVNSSGLTTGRAGSAPANSSMNSSANRPANGPMNQRAVAPNAPTHNTPSTNGRPTNTPNTSGVSPRQRELSQNRPPSAMPSSSRTPNAGMSNNPPLQRESNSPRTWEAQGNATDRGRAPAGFGNSNRPANMPAKTARMSDANRPLWARTSQSGVSQMQPRGSFSEPSRGSMNSPAMRESNRPATPNYNNNRPSYSDSGRSYEPPQRNYRDTPSYNNRGYSEPRSYNPPQRDYRDTPSYDNNRGYSEPRSYNPPQRNYRDTPSYNNRGYSEPRSYNPPSHSYNPPPTHSYSAPRTYSAPSPSYGGGGSYRGGSSGGSSHGSSGGTSRGNGGGSQGNGGSVSLGSRH